MEIVFVSFLFFFFIFVCYFKYFVAFSETKIFSMFHSQVWNETYLICCVGCIHDRVPSGSSLSDVIGPRFWFRSLPGGKLNIRLLLRAPDDG